MEVDGIDWAAMRPDWVGDHGSIIVLLGSQEHPDTVLGNPHAGETDTKGLSIYLNTRFWDLSDVEVKVAELRSDKKSQWPQSGLDRDDKRRPNNRTMNGARHFIVDVNGGSEGKPKANGIVELAEGRVRAEWYLWEGQRPSYIHQQAKKGGYIAIRYKGELFQLSSSKPHFRWFGVIENKVQQNLTIILEPKHYDPSNGRWGVHPDQSRNRLIFSGNGNKGTELPLADWAMEFAESMPDEILEAIRAARGEKSGTIEDAEYRKRLQDKFGSRWSVRGLVVANANETATSTGTPIDAGGAAPPQEGEPRKKAARRSRPKASKTARKRASAGGSTPVVEADVPVDVPRYRFGHKENFQADWHLAVWAPNDPDGPCVVINVDSPILEEIVQYHQGQYADVYAEEVAETVREVFGEVAACKIAHSQKLSKRISEEELDRDYRSEQALTVALMGLLAEEAVIGQRLAKLGRKKAA